MRAGEEGGGCFPTGKHYPGIAHLLRVVLQGLVDEIDTTTPIEDVPLVAIDTETTGTDFAVDRVLEIAAIVWHRGEVVARHRWLVNPERGIPKESFDVHGIGDDAVKDQPVFAKVAHEILSTLHGHVPLAYNAEFDRNFLLEEFDRAKVGSGNMPPAARRGIEWVDPLVWAREIQKDEKSRSLKDVAERLGVTLEKAHSALDDAEAAVRVLAAFLGDDRVPRTYGGFIQEQRRLARLHDENRQFWQKG